MGASRECELIQSIRCTWLILEISHEYWMLHCDLRWAYCFHFQAFCKVGQFIAGQLGLGFSKDGLQQKQVEKSKRAQEPWRSLYL